MAKISFYLFEKSPERQVESACRLSRKILRQSARIWFYCSDQGLRQQLDERLWTFDEASFIPHGIDQPHAPVCISEHLPEQDDWIVFNFNNQALEQCSHFSHIIEIIENNDDAKIIGREKFKQYRRLGIAPQTYKL
ncbi:DNA polymerase III subunit chi [Acinetobacter cumulans]|jgi:DNA polymerase-3 subunit chi|uniref:DNA polymerase III subunit chi n=1 Tax=Acinetobacter cumulans TaxID=2136182 RepID=A0A3A8G6A4_9GAMM|nr:MULTISPECIES: DNA polymerase III subunit chi [Acinetobacter]NWK72723.1 DNA polymerase III subunit chi [Acinetobacter sp. SwsAc6]QCO20556.1 DNA polymerase III subunit chi [Acinetobacter cumulans]RFS33359.1 DNA polymerase III subunit chi [Acinetobacter sp. SWAC5]RKG46011.1 DNA polymerase III subunit chi [Acinetobacter cumulans]RKG47958.1 DNA polymerase III subunit chi [Acinetobacter cumulans]